MRKLSLLLPFVLAGCAPLTEGTDDTGSYAELGANVVRFQAPDVFRFDELLALSTLDGRRAGSSYVLDGAPAGLEAKLNQLLTTPVISNEAFTGGERTSPQRGPDGPMVRAVEWNIERGQQLPAILHVLRAAEDAGEREALFGRPAPAGLENDPVEDTAEHYGIARAVTDDPALKATVSTQLDALKGVDVLILNEVDNGMRRSGYKDVAREIAQQQRMNYAWGAEFIEIDPMQLGREQVTREQFLPYDTANDRLMDDGTVSEDDLTARVTEVNARLGVDEARAKNLTGNAILSRYPIVAARNVPLKTVCWDWNAEEKKKRDFVNRAQNVMAQKLFLERIAREERHGGRAMLAVDLYVPGVNAKGTTMEYVDGERTNIVTVVTAHIEAKSTPECRAAQAAEVLSLIKDVKNPVIFAGDLNTLGTDGRPMTVMRLLKGKFANPQWLMQQVVTRLLPYSSWAFTARDIFNFIRLKDDPTGINIPFIFPNPERRLFDRFEQFSFDDGAAFDFRGDPSRTINGTGHTLANSNQRDDKGFKCTNAFERPLGVGSETLIGKFKIDWFFVRGYARAPRDTKASYRMAPQRSQTLEELRDATAPRLADHAPIVIDLPIGDPGCADGACSGRDTSADDPYQDVTWIDAVAQ